ncbi:ATP-binding protein [Alteromonadaceae bacterium BrNp21-10]|nr:ATP-binding protein [Alteromonadaceae bacterium BrNp21-10]
MSTSSKLSIKSLMLYVAMTTSTIALIVTAGIFQYLQVENFKRNMSNDVVMLANFIGHNSVAAILFEDADAEQSNLQKLADTPNVDHVHIYTQDSDAEFSLFASYNREGTSHVTTVFDHLDQLNTPQFNDIALEVAVPIKDNDKTIGYVYMNSSIKELTTLTRNTIMLTLAIMVVLIAMSFLLSLRLQKRVTGPIGEFVNLVQNISANKDYSVRAKVSDIKELAILANAFNVLLERVQKHMIRQKEAEEEYRSLNTNLEQKVSQRTLALKESNQELIQTLEKLHQFQRQLVQNEKMASLGDMVAGVAHEVNTPIGLGVTASTMMLDRLADLQRDFDNKELKASTLGKYLNESKENLNIIYRNLNRSAELISSFKQVAVDQTSENSRTFSVQYLLEEIIMSLRPRLKQTKHEIKLNCEPQLYIECKAGPINQILINLIMNSLIHGFEYMDVGQIDISAHMLGNDKLKLVYKDNGKGLPEHLRKRIFDPFVTTKRGRGGSGLGMHLVFNLVTQALGGNIEIESVEGKGTSFEIVFPVRKANGSEMVKIS